MKVINKYTEHKKLSILDFGCGVGTLSLYLADKGNNVLGIDISKKAITLANKSRVLLHKNLSVLFCQSSIDKLKIKRKFDLILLLEVLEHVPNDLYFLRLLSKHLKSKGLIIISVPSLNAPLHKLGILNKFDRRVGHLRRYSTDMIINRLTKVDLKIVKIYKFEGFLRNLLFTNRGFNFLIRFLKGPLSIFANFIDSLSVSYFGESQLVFILQKKFKK